MLPVRSVPSVAGPGQIHRLDGECIRRDVHPIGPDFNHRIVPDKKELPVPAGTGSRIPGPLPGSGPRGGGLRSHAAYLLEGLKGIRERGLRTFHFHEHDPEVFDDDEIEGPAPPAGNVLHAAAPAGDLHRFIKRPERAPCPGSSPAPVFLPVLFEVFEPVAKVVDPVEDLLVHPVLPLHKRADQVTGRSLELHVRDLGILPEDLSLRLSPEYALWCRRPPDALPPEGSGPFSKSRRRTFTKRLGLFLSCRGCRAGSRFTGPIGPGRFFSVSCAFFFIFVFTLLFFSDAAVAPANPPCTRQGFFIEPRRAGRIRLRILCCHRAPLTSGTSAGKDNLL